MNTSNEQGTDMSGTTAGGGNGSNPGTSNSANATTGGRGNASRSSATGRGQGRRNRGARGSRAGTRTNTDFKGDMSEMNGHIFQTFQESQDHQQFVKTLEALGHYINKNMKYGSGLTVLYKSLEQPKIVKPSAAGLDLDNDAADKIEWAETYKGYISRRRELEDNLQRVYTVAWGQCSEPMKSKLMSLEKFPECNSTCDCVWLLRSIRAITYKFDEQRDICLFLCECLNPSDNKLDTVMPPISRDSRPSSIPMNILVDKSVPIPVC